MSQNLAKPPRTIGIALAIIMSTLFYTVAPLGFAGFTYTLQSRMRNSDIIIGTGASEIPGGSVGFSSISSLELGLWAGLAVAFLAVAVMAWFGGSSRIRYIFMMAVVLMPISYGGLWAYRQYRDGQALAETGAMVSGSGFPAICSSALLFPVFVTLYVVWYMSRGPARAFYRGHYLDRNDESEDQS